MDSWDTHVTVTIVVVAVLTGACLIRRFVKTRVLRMTATGRLAISILEALGIKLTLKTAQTGKSSVKRRKRSFGNRSITAKRSKFFQVQYQTSLSSKSNGKNNVSKNAVVTSKPISAIDLRQIIEKKVEKPSIVEFDLDKTNKVESDKENEGQEKRAQNGLLYSLVPLPPLRIHVAKVYAVAYEAGTMESYV